MKINEALILLNLNNIYTVNNINELSVNELKKNYHIQSLIWHPDKNNTKNTNEYFIKIKEAYNYILHYLNHNNDNNNNDNNYINEDNSYFNLFIDFIKILSKNNSNEDIINFKNNCNKYFNKIIENIINNLSVNTLKELYLLLSKLDNDNSYNIDINNIIFKNIKDILLAKLQYYNIFILHPNLQNLLNSDIFKLKTKNDLSNNMLEDNIIYIPLWHNELNYENNIIIIEPIIDDNIIIDEYNNIYINYSETYENIIENIKNNDNNPQLKIKIENNDLFIPINELSFKKNQHYVFKNIGIPLININNIFDNSKKGDIIININLK